MLDLEKKRFISVFDSTVDGLFMMDADNKVTHFNSTFYQQFDLDLDNTYFDDWLALIHPDDKETFTHSVSEHIRDIEGQNKNRVVRYRARRSDGKYCWIEATGMMKSDSTGEYMVGSHRDITEQKRMESYVRKIAFYDKVSGLPNNDKLRKDLGKLDGSFTLVHIHLDQLRSYINQYGEELVAEIVERVVACLGVFSCHNCNHYRNSMATFSVLIYGEVSESRLAEMCHEFVTNFSLVSKQEGKLFAGDVYVGAYPCNDNSLSAEEVINWSAQTCEYAAKHESGHWAICNPRIKKKVERFFYVESMIKHAIENKEISIRLQPIVCSKTYQVLSFEALARWDRGSKGEIYPDEFIPVAERKGLIDLLGEEVLGQACGFISDYNARWNSNVCVNVNVSVLQLLDGQFPQKAFDIIHQKDVPANQVVLELTESVLIDDKHQAMSQIRQLKVLGFHLAMDDFGSGHSSTTGLFRLPYNQIKIDREFSVEATKDDKPLAYLRFITEMCTESRASVTIEGIETREMLERFADVDISAYQGYLFSRPMKSDEALCVSPDCALLK